MPDHSQSTSTSSSPVPFVATQSRDITLSYDSPCSRPNELLRARELLRYFTPPSPVPVEDVPIGGDKDVNCGDDPALRAFSHLLALKLDCERSMISLIDQTNQCASLSLYPIVIKIENTVIDMLLLKQHVHCLLPIPRDNPEWWFLTGYGWAASRY
jgi:hypothetical protein